MPPSRATSTSGPRPKPAPRPKGSWRWCSSSSPRGSTSWPKAVDGRPGACLGFRRQLTRGSTQMTTQGPFRYSHTIGFYGVGQGRGFNVPVDVALGRDERLYVIKPGRQRERPGKWRASR